MSYPHWDDISEKDHAKLQHFFHSRNTLCVNGSKNKPIFGTNPSFLSIFAPNKHQEQHPYIRDDSPTEQ